LLLGFAGVIYSHFRKTKDYIQKQWLWGVMCFCSVLFTSIQFTNYQQQKNEWRQPFAYFSAVVTINETPRYSKKTIHTIAKIDQLITPDSIIPSNSSVQLFFPKHTTIETLLPGNKLLIHGRFQQPYKLLSPAKGIAASAYISQDNYMLYPLAASLSIKQQLLRYQYFLSKRLEKLSLPKESETILSAITLGNSTLLTSDLRSKFSTIGCAHLLAVSGFHVTIITGALFLLLGCIPFIGGNHTLIRVLMLLLIWVFALLTGLSPATVRASTMVTLYIVGKLLYEQKDTYNILVAAAFLMLFYQPLYLFDLGFQLSFLALLAILYLQPKIGQWIQVRNPIISTPWSCLTLSLTAQVGTAPLCLYAFGAFPLLFLFTNLPLTIFATVLIPITLGWLIVEPLFPWLGHVIASVIQIVSSWMLYIIESFSSIPGASFQCSFNLKETFASYLFIFSTCCLFKYKQPKSLIFWLFTLLLFIVIQLI
jgi:competence protein ComEC